MKAVWERVIKTAGLYNIWQGISHSSETCSCLVSLSKFTVIWIQVWWTEEAKHLYARQAHLARRGVWEAWHWARKGANPSSRHWYCRCPPVGSSCQKRPVNKPPPQETAPRVTDTRALPTGKNYNGSSWNVAVGQNAHWLPPHRVRPISSAGFPCCMPSQCAVLQPENRIHGQSS